MSRGFFASDNTDQSPALAPAGSLYGLSARRPAQSGSLPSIEIIIHQSGAKLKPKNKNPPDIRARALGFGIPARALKPLDSAIQREHFIAGPLDLAPHASARPETR